MTRTYSCHSEEIEHLAAISPGVGISVLGLTLVCNDKVKRGSQGLPNDL